LCGLVDFVPTGEHHKRIRRRENVRSDETRRARWG
jgi:hypothetical protein